MNILLILPTFFTSLLYENLMLCFVIMVGFLN